MRADTRRVRRVESTGSAAVISTFALSSTSALRSFPMSVPVRQTITVPFVGFSRSVTIVSISVLAFVSFAVVTWPI